MGLSGNENTTILDKRAVQLPPVNHNALLLQDCVLSVHRSIRASYQYRWDQRVADGNKLAQLKPFLGSLSSFFAAVLLLGSFLVPSPYWSYSSYIRSSYGCLPPLSGSSFGFPCPS